MTASELAFLALGLLLGVAAGAALVEILRARPPASPEVRVTMTPAVLPSRSVTLAGDPYPRSAAAPAPGGPGDRRTVDRPLGPQPWSGEEAGPPLIRPAFVPVFATAGATPPGAPGTFVDRTPVLPDTPPPTRGLAAVRPRTSIMAALADPPAAPPVTIVAAAEIPAGETSASETAEAHRPPAAAGPCAELRAIAEDRCTVASRARERAETAHAALQDARRAFDDDLRLADEADALADPRAIRSAKEAAQQAFRAARERAGSRDELETAARTWLATINRINLDARDAAARAAKARAGANALVTTIERLTAEADAGRIAKETAEEACLSARQAVAECEEASTAAEVAAATAVPLATIEAATHYPDDEPELATIATGDREARVVRLLRGDRDALLRTVAELAGDDAEERRRWQIALTGFVDAVVAQAIDAAAFDVPETPPFWAPFAAEQRREIAAALASLGYRFDGLGGFADGRVPSQRDLSLALGYAGLDPMRVRRWPTEAEARELFAGVRVAADEYLAAAAGGLRLSEMVDLLGRRADGLTDLWNEWGRVRPRLLAAD